ncbi:Taiman-D-like protein, partial [Leptotrombidium deliense]
DEEEERKCNSKNISEKRRRDQENVYIEELAELIYSRLSDMNSFSVKPDKCAILEETVKQIRIIKSESNSDLQGCEVSSSKPTIIASQVFGPLLLEALDGFLFVINKEAKIEFISENVVSYLKFKQNELMNKSIYTIVDLCDQSKFNSCFIDGASDGIQSKFTRCFNCKFMINEEMKNKWETMIISSVLIPFPLKDHLTNENEEICLINW